MRYRFGDFVVDTTSYSLSRAGRPLQARPKVFDVLRYLIEHRERVVTKRELLETLWHEQHVDEFAVPWTVSHVRRLLGQRRGEQRPIQTIHGRGYRFVTELVELAAAIPDAQPPRAISAPAPNPFVGRELVMQRLEAHMAEAKQGRGSCCLLVGAAGMGKTRCMDELGGRAAAADFAVWNARSIEATCGPVFWPWIQVLRALVHALPSLADEGRALIARLAADEDDAESDTQPAEAGRAGRARTPASDRFWRYDAIAGLLQAAAQHQPIMLAFDDLHWADAGTWELLGYLAPELRHWPILIVGAKREDSRASSRHPSGPQLRETERIELSALNARDVEEYLRLLTGVELTNTALTDAIQAASLGNPWFMRETVQALLLRHGLAALSSLDASAVQPASAAVDVLRDRLATLTPDAQSVLSLASVWGERFEIDLLASMSGMNVERVLEALDAARDAGLVSIEPPRRARFDHGLLRSVLYDELALPERLKTHREAARRLEGLLDPTRYAEIAHHYYCSLPLGDDGSALRAALRAAEQAARALALADAAQFLEWATAAQTKDPDAPPRARAELLLRRADMERQAGREAQARASATSVLELARQFELHDLQVGAARVLRPTYALGPMPDPLALAALEEVLQRAPQGPCAERVGALSMLSWIPPHALDMAQSKALSAEALALAGELGSSSALREALHARLYALSGPDDIDALLATAEQLASVPGEPPIWARTEPLVASYRAHLYRSDLNAADASLAALGREAQRHGLTEVVWFHDFFQAQRLFVIGDFAGAEALFDDLAARGARLRLAHAPLLDAVAKTLLRYERDGFSSEQQGLNLDATLAVLLTLPANYSATGARLAVERGQLEPARQALHRLSQHAFAPVVKDLGYVNTLANLSVVAVALGDRVHAQALYELLAPYLHHNTPNGVFGFPEGSASRFLAGLAAFLNEAALARRHFEDALALNEALGALPQVAHTCYEYARWLGQQQRGALARRNQQRTVELAERLGMRDLAARARAL